MRAQEKVQKFAEVVCRDRPRLLRDAWAHDAKTTAQGWHREKTNAAAGTENHHFRLTTVYAEENTQKELRAFFKTTTSCWDTSDGPLNAAIFGSQRSAALGVRKGQA